MFGGAALYSVEFFFGLIADDVLYLRVDDSNRADYSTRLVAGHTGVTVHDMTPTLDAGAVLEQQPMAVSGRVSVFTATGQLYRAGTKLLVEVIDRVVRGEAGTPQSTPGTYQSWPSRADIRALRRQGGALNRLSDLADISSAHERRRTSAEAARADGR